MWTPEAINIGFPNRLFVVGADRKPRIARAAVPDEKTLAAVRAGIVGQLARLPLKLSFTPEAARLWDEWYANLPSHNVHTKRLDTIGLRLLAILALAMDRDAVDADVVKVVILILNYEFALRMATDPIDAANAVARMEISIRRQLKARGPLRKYRLKQWTNANREGLWCFETALDNLIESNEVGLKNGCYYSMGDPDA